MSYENPWIYNGEPVEKFEEGVQGFVYILECLVTGKKYIGKKNAVTFKTSVKTITQKNGIKKKKKTKIPIDSDWRDYYGSSAEFVKHVETVGRINIRRTILYICLSKSEMSYYEAYEQFIRNALLSEEYVNSWIMVRVRKDNLKSIRK